MKRVIIYFAIFLIGSANLLIAQDTLSVVSTSNGFKIIIRLNSEQGIKQVEIYRSNPEGKIWTLVSVIKPNGQGVYEVEDDNLYKTDGTVFLYKAVIVFCDQTKNNVETSHYAVHYEGASSASKRTWGSIKALFR